MAELHSYKQSLKSVAGCQMQVAGLSDTGVWDTTILRIGCRF